MSDLVLRKGETVTITVTGVVEYDVRDGDFVAALQVGDRRVIFPPDGVQIERHFPKEPQAFGSTVRVTYDDGDVVIGSLVDNDHRPWRIENRVRPHGSSLWFTWDKLIEGATKVEILFDPSKVA